MTSEDLAPIEEAQVELRDIAHALETQDATWFHGNQSLAPYYAPLADRLQTLYQQLRATGGENG